MLVDDLRHACADDWHAFTQHAFLAGIADGSLPEAAFREYLIQDYRFLVHFARAHALEAFKADTVADLEWAASAAAGIISTEMRMHVEYCAAWGIDEAQLEAAVEAPENVAYTSFVIETGLAGDALDLAVSLMPCTVGYGEIGARLLADPSTDLGEGNPYAPWISAYGGQGFQDGVVDASERLERLSLRHGGSERFEQLCAIFAEAARLEAAFWQMGIDRGSAA